MNSNTTEMNKARIQQIISDKMPQANVIEAKVLLVFAATMIFFWIIFQAGFLHANDILVSLSLLGGAGALTLISAICIIRHGKGNWLKYAMLTTLMICILLIDLMSGYKMNLALAIPIILSKRYYDNKFTCAITVACIISLVICTLFNAYLYDVVDYINLSTVSFPVEVNITVKDFLFNEVVAQSPDPRILLRNGILLYLIPNSVVLVLINAFVLLVLRIDMDILLKSEELVEKELQQKIELNELQTRVMLSQIQPHFMYNTLGAVAALCDINPERAKKLTIDFSNYLRANLKTLSSDGPISFEKEILHTKTYLMIEKERFGDRLHFEFNIKSIDFMIPALTVQPLVENSVKHGICTKRTGGTVQISSYDTENDHIVIIEDDGIGFDQDQINWNDSVHIGIKNIRERLHYFCNGTLTMESSSGEGTKATVVIPKDGWKSEAEDHR